MSNKKEINDFIKKILSETDLDKYELVLNENDDKDINYLVEYSLNKKMKIKFIIYYSERDALSIYLPSVYRLDENKFSLMYTLNIINEVNCDFALGKLYLSKKNNAVVSYLNRILFTDIKKELTSELLNDYIKAFIFTLMEFYKKIGVEMQTNE